MVTIDPSVIRCPNCLAYYKPVLGVRKHSSMMIQDEFPKSLPWEREQLISGICSDKCWDQYLSRIDAEEEGAV